ncbi:MAG TPA: MBL fold metallo-hydrolase [Holophagaceae bacterium]|nr:MBL fold metallo-hydrolase [Holophagaceae bacterium]
MRYAALASGSKGNCHAVSDGGRTLLIDAGISLAQIRARLGFCGLDPASVRAVALTHEHSDHRAAVGVLVRNTDWAFLATADTKAAVEAAVGETIPAGRWIEVRAGHRCAWEGWDVTPFALPHDAVDPVAFRVDAAGLALAVVTDLGHGTALVADHCAGLDFLALEANHDVEMLRTGSYPDSLKARILSRVGHLSNAAMAELLARVASPRLRAVVLAHLSEQNNHPDLARLAALEALRGDATDLHLATQQTPLALDLLLERAG